MEADEEIASVMQRMGAIREDPYVDLTYEEQEQEQHEPLQSEGAPTTPAPTERDQQRVVNPQSRGPERAPGARFLPHRGAGREL